MLPSDLRPVFATLATVLDDVLSGATDPKVATAAATVARAMAAIFATGEQEQRMRDLEAAINALQVAAGTGERRHRPAHGSPRAG
jgi:hypothetical protein